MGKKKKIEHQSTDGGTRTEPEEMEAAALEEWLTKMRSTENDGIIIRQRFPHEAWRDQYLEMIQTRDTEEVLFLIRSFLIESVFTNRCEISYMALNEVKRTSPQLYEQAMADSFTRRLVRYAEEPDAGHSPPWEGNTWVADLLPDNPKLALQGLEAYIHAYRGHFSDNQILGHDDVEQLIRAKFIGLPGSYPEASACWMMLDGESWSVLLKGCTSQWDTTQS